jgi:lipopolysaccharide export system protein LptC
VLAFLPGEGEIRRVAALLDGHLPADTMLFPLYRALPFAQVDVEALAREPRIDMPRYAGMTEDGAALSVTARDVRSDAMGQTRLTARALVAVVETPDGATNQVTADLGEIDRADDALRLAGNVRLTTGAGYVVSTEALVASLDRTHLESPGPVTTRIPGGSLDAGTMRLMLDAAVPGNVGTGSYVLVFSDGVRMLYTPGIEE